MGLIHFTSSLAAGHFSAKTKSNHVKVYCIKAGTDDSIASKKHQKRVAHKTKTLVREAGCELGQVTIKKLRQDTLFQNPLKNVMKSCANASKLQICAFTVHFLLHKCCVAMEC